VRRLPYFLLQLFLFCLPFQLSKYVWVSESLVLGRRVDYLAPVIYLSDILVIVTLAACIYTKQLRISRSTALVLFTILALAAVAVVVSPIKQVTLYLIKIG
jgi:hypothetical protein